MPFRIHSCLGRYITEQFNYKNSYEKCVESEKKKKRRISILSTSSLAISIMNVLRTIFVVGDEKSCLWSWRDNIFGWLISFKTVLLVWRIRVLESTKFSLWRAAVWWINPSLLILLSAVCRRSGLSCLLYFLVFSSFFFFFFRINTKMFVSIFFDCENMHFNWPSRFHYSSTIYK